MDYLKTQAAARAAALADKAALERFDVVLCLFTASVLFTLCCVLIGG